jgi:hypothetical protein
LISIALLSQVSEMEKLSSEKLPLIRLIPETLLLSHTVFRAYS